MILQEQLPFNVYPFDRTSLRKVRKLIPTLPNVYLPFRYRQCVDSESMFPSLVLMIVIPNFVDGNF